jgi:energy-coupling factor transport system substrate-specific component
MTALPMHPRAVAALVLASTVGLIAFFWPFLAAPESAAVAHAADAPLLFALLMPVLLAVVLSQMTTPGSGAKAIAMLGVLAALVAALRPLGAGHAGIEPFWFLIIIGGRALGPGFGFALGAVGIFASALLTGGFGPWVPFQMIGAAWVGMGAGLLPRRLSGRAEVLVLAVYGAGAAIVFGFLLNAWFWPFFSGSGVTFAFVPGAPAAENLARLLLFSLTTSLGYDLPRAIITAGLTLLAGGALLRSLRRAAQRANFATTVAFPDDAGAMLEVDPAVARPASPAHSPVTTEPHR